jgi:hypothetical protein
MKDEVNMMLTEKQREEELEQEFQYRENIFMPAKYCLRYFEYFGTLEKTCKEKNVNVCFLISYIKFAVGVVLILNLSKLFNEGEKYSLAKICKRFSKDYVMNDNIRGSVKRLKILRDKYYAHTDDFVYDSTIGLYLPELKQLLNKAESILCSIKLDHFNISVNYDLTDAELGITFLEECFPSPMKELQKI